MEPTPRKASAETLPLTASQASILAGQQLQAEDPLYNMVLTFSISGLVQHLLFQQAFQALIDNCDALRTVFVEQEGVFRQYVQAQYSYQVELVDFSTEAAPQAALAAWVEERSGKHFIMQQCLFESVLLKLSESDFVWYLNQHHLLTDAWSVGVIFEKLQSLYALAVAGNLPAATALPDFSEYVASQATRGETPQLQKARTYWREKLASPFTASTFYRHTPRQIGGRTRRVRCVLGAARSARIRTLIAREEFSAFTPDLSLMQVFATVLFTYLHRITGNHRLSIGTPCHSRTTARLKETVGLLIEIFPLIVDVEPRDSFHTVFEKVSAANHELLMHALPAATGVERQRHFDVLLNFIPSSFGSFNSLPVKSEWIHPGFGDRKHLLRLQVHNFDQADEFTLFFDLNESVFVGGEADWVGEHFLRLLDALLDDADQCVAAPPLVDSNIIPAYESPVQASQENPLLAETVVELFQRQCEHSPDSMAVSCAAQSLSYAELDERSSLLAAYLQHNGLGRGAVVAIAMRRSIDVVVAILGVVKSGCVFLPVDAAYPQERIAFILADADAALVLTLEDSDLLHAGITVPLCCVDADWEQIAAVSSAPPQTRPGLDDTAYLIYTSGSTGEPKGVVVDHASLGNYISWAKRYYLAGEVLDFPLFSSLSFDLTITSLFVPLVSGGQIVVYPEPGDASEITIRQVIEDNRVDVIKLTPAHLTLIQAMDFSRSRLSRVIVGGEDFKAESAHRLAQYFGGRIQIFNEYGPTEGTVASTVHRFDPATDTGASVPIGTPISNARIYILDAHMNRVPQGVAGEIYIGGAGVARGYLNRPELTAERFVHNPFQSGEILYRSGDLACCNERGQIQYLGRNDHQVKIRGVRIETSEVEAALMGEFSITEAVVDAAQHFPMQGGVGEEQNCQVCGLSGNHPSAQLDDERVCRLCRVYEVQSEQAQSYFRSLDDLQSLIAGIRAGAGSGQDCIMLLSGGKDSSYALCRLVDMGLTPLVFTLDNGYISEGAKANIRRLVDKLGLELVVGETPAMNAIFADSLNRHSNVCNGCFKTIYTLSMNLARERGITCICTGLSRGQIFETRVAHLFQQGIYDADVIDRSIIEARRAYHRTEDIIAQSLDVKIFEDDGIFEDIQYLDFYRYTDVTLAQMLDYLSTRAPWVRPADTGRSTNCLINEAGIYVHKKERGYHNYALPYSWDVRLGHKERDAALAELDDDIDPQKVERILDEIAYQQRDTRGGGSAEDYLVAYYVAAAEIPEARLKQHLAKSLPLEFIPRHFVWLEKLPLTQNGKLDRQALPRPTRGARQLAQDYVAPMNDTEATLARIWSRMLDLENVGVSDNFFDLGGDSIVNIQIVAAARAQAIEITPQQIFDYPTVRELAAVAGALAVVAAEQGPVVGEVPLLPSQRRFFDTRVPDVNACNQSVLLQYHGQLDPDLLEQSLAQLLSHHDALRCRFTRSVDGWCQEILEPAAVSTLVGQVDIAGLDAGQQLSTIENQARHLYGTLDIERGKLVAVTNFCAAGQAPGFLLLVVHHLVVDGVSWWILLGDLENIYRQLESRAAVKLAPKTSSLRQWASALENFSTTAAVIESEPYWREQANPAAGILAPQAHSAALPRATAGLYSVSLGRAETRRLIHEVPGAYGVQVPEVLMTALLRTVLPWSGGAALQVDMEAHGREDSIGSVDLIRSVAWFTSVYPICLHLSPSGNPGEDLKAIKDQMRTVPLQGISYSLLRYLQPAVGARPALASLVPSQVLFNYMGQWGRTLAAESRFSFVRPIQAFHGNTGQRAYPWEINALVFDEQLRLDWTYDPELHAPELVEKLARQFLDSVAELIAYCVSTDDSSLTPSDFPDADLNQAELDDLLAEFGDATD